MKVILLQDVKKLGKKGDIIEVSEGYGRNFLLPRKLAAPGTSENISEAAKAQYDIDLDKKKVEIKDPIKSLGDYDVTIRVHPTITSVIKIHVVEG